MNNYLTATEWAHLVGPEKFCELSAKLAKKKAVVRSAVSANKIKKDGNNGKYKYLTESGYKTIINAALAKAGLELSATQIAVERYDSKAKSMPEGVQVEWQFILTDTETGFYEANNVSGAGVDMADKGIYKAHTGAMKYYAANNWLVATGDDAEAVNPDEAMDLSEMLVECMTMKQDAEDAGVNLHDAQTMAWIVKHSGVKDGVPKSMEQARKYMDCLARLTEGMKAKQAQA